METRNTFRPRPARQLPPIVLVVLVVVGAAGAMAWQLATSTLTIRDAALYILTALAAGGFVLWVSLDERRARSVQIDAAGVSGLAWRRVLGFIPAGLERVEMPWSAIRDVGKRDLMLWFDDGRHRLS